MNEIAFVYISLFAIRIRAIFQRTAFILPLKVYKSVKNTPLQEVYYM